jgi:hypothetical protein
MNYERGRHSTTGSNLEPLHFHTEVYLREYEVVRREMEYRFNAQEQSFTYLISLVVGALAVFQLLQDASSGGLQGLVISPFIYLAAAVILMFFPISFVYHNAVIVLLGLYQYEVLAEKLDKIASELGEIDEVTKSFSEWESRMFHGTPYKGTLRWDYYRLYNQAGQGVMSMLFAPLASFRPLALTFTPLLLLVLFLQNRQLSSLSTWNTADFLTMAAFLICCLIFLYGSWYVIRAQRRALKLAMKAVQA